MTKKQKLRRNSFAANFNAREDDFILVDLNVMLDEEEPSPVPLNHFLDDEETIDRLLINSGFDANDELDEGNREPDELLIDDIRLDNEFTGVDKFVVEPIEQTEQNRHTETEEISASDFHLMADFDEIADEEDAIDRLLIDAGFDANDELEQGDVKPNAVLIDDISWANKFDVQFEEQSAMAADAGNLDSTESELALDKDATNVFLVKEETPENARLVAQAISEATYPKEALESLNNKAGITMLSSVRSEQEAIKTQINDYFEEQNAMDAIAGIIDSEVKEENPETAKQAQAISETTYPDKAVESLNNDAGITTLSSVRSEQEAIKKQINDYENKVKKAAIITYTSLSFGIVALLSTVVMGVIVSGMQTKVSKLTELVSIIEEDMSSIAEKNSDMEINNSDSSIEQLNQKVNVIPKQSEEKSQFSSGMLAIKMRTVVAKQATVNKSLDDPKTRAPVLEKKKLSEASVEKVSAKKKVELQKHLIDQSQSSADTSKSNMTVAAKKQAAFNKSIDNQKTKTHVIEKKKPSKTTVKMTSAKKKTNSAQTAAGWSVLLTAYEDLSYANSKAAKLIQKGIPVKVIAVNMNNTTWYRLKVGGFKNKEKATSYAAKIKKSLKLNTVSVGNI